jgi:hypothetical protein
MTETRLEEVQRIVYGYDTEAGHKLRYLITRAQVDKKFADKIGFTQSFNASMWGDLAALFAFYKTDEGHDYWWRVQFNTENRFVTFEWIR